MASRALTVLRVGSAVSRVLPLRLTIRLVELLAPRIGPRLMAGKAAQLRSHIRRVMAHGLGQDGATGAPTGGSAPAGDAGPGVGADAGGGLGLDRVAALDLAGSEADRRMRRGLGSYGRYWVETFRVPYVTDRELDRGFSFLGYGKIEEVRATGVGPILVLPHLGSWEWAAAWLGRVARTTVTAVVEVLEPPEVFDWFGRLRQAFGVNVVPLGPRAMVDLVAAVKRTDIVCLLADRDIGGNGVEVEFFGERTTLPVGPALLSRRTGAPLLPTAVFFRGRQRVTVVGDPIWPDGSGRGREENQQLMQQVAAKLEELVVQAPEQWHLLEPNWPSDRVG